MHTHDLIVPVLGISRSGRRTIARTLAAAYGTKERVYSIDVKERFSDRIYSRPVFEVPIETNGKKFLTKSLPGASTMDASPILIDGSYKCVFVIDTVESVMDAQNDELLFLKKYININDLFFILTKSDISGCSNSLKILSNMNIPLDRPYINVVAISGDSMNEVRRFFEDMIFV